MKILNDQRERYLKHLTATLEEARTLNETCSTELLLQPGQMDDPEPAFRLYRIDVATTNGGAQSLLDANVDPEPVSLSLSDYSAPVFVRELAWNDVQLNVVSSELPIDEIALWATRWLDMDDHNAAGPDGFQGVVHSVLRPERSAESSWVLNIDMGSAPALALEELLRIVSAGAESVEVLSSNPRPGA